MSKSIISSLTFITFSIVPASYNIANAMNKDEPMPKRPSFTPAFTSRLGTIVETPEPAPANKKNKTLPANNKKTKPQGEKKTDSK